MALTEEEKRIAYSAWLGTSGCEDALYAAVEAVKRERNNVAEKPMCPHNKPTSERCYECNPDEIENLGCAATPILAPAPGDADVVERMVAAAAKFTCDVSLRPEHWKSIMTAAFAVARKGMCSEARLVEELRFIQQIASGEKQVAPDDTDGMKFIERFVSDMLAHLSAPPAAKDRVMVVGAVVYLDGKEYACFKGHDSHEPANLYAAGLRLELDKQH